MDVFALRQQLIADYAAYVQSFINISDASIEAVVEQELEAGLLWPEPLIQLNPAFAPGAGVNDLTTDGTLHPLCREIFQIKKPGKIPKPLRLHLHQLEALQAAQTGDPYVLTTGTGSGKSLAYIIPIVNATLRRGSGQGIQAIIVYPMNALANSQQIELEKFLLEGFSRPPVTFRRYTGQEDDTEKQDIIANPPDILLTNYVMLELLLTRPHERNLVAAARGLRFLVLDELHTYRGRQGADVAMLVRRVREMCETPHLQCIGTSATLAAGGTFAEQQQSIAAVASRLFGAPVKPARVIGETLHRVTPERDPKDTAYLAELTRQVGDPDLQPPKSFTEFVRQPLASWIESTFGLTAEAESGRLRRATPRSLTGDDGAAKELATLTGLPEAHCATTIAKMLLAGYHAENPETGFPAFAFRLHQFIGRGDTVYASPETPQARYITMHGQQYAPGDRRRVLLPLAFCRECGQPYYVVRQHTGQDGVTHYLPRDLGDQSAEPDQESGFLYLNPDAPWPEDSDEILTRLPEDWLDVRPDGTLKVKSHLKRSLPAPVMLNTAGEIAEQGTPGHFLPAPFRFCLRCDVAYGGHERSDLGKLAGLSSGGRSTATTVLSLSALRALRQDMTLASEARKLLSFTDNRQDAALQAGHFNDFVEVGLLRAGLYRAVVEAGENGLTHETLAMRVCEALALSVELYAANPDAKFKARDDAERALREVIAYRLYRDLRRGWRVTAPNLEQCGLLEIRYQSLDDLCNAAEEWTALHPALATAIPEQRFQIAETLLDYLRRELVIKVDYLDPSRQESIQQQSSQHLIEPWAIDENETLEHAKIVFPRSERRGDYGGNLYLSPRGGFGMYLRRQGTFPAYTEKLNQADTELIIRDLLRVMEVAGLVQPVVTDKQGHDATGYQVPASALIWRADDGTRPSHDPIRSPRPSTQGGRSNSFFTDLYRQAAGALQGFEAREHTAQVPYEERLEREERFRKASLPLLYCSPTMELGVDIAQLNAVNLRNVPPTPANYAQRSGRAGRSGQPALVFTYCTTGSPHDQYFFKRPERMVAGAVAPPRLDLANEDLIRAHVHAVWLAETGLSLGVSLKDMLDLAPVDGAPVNGMPSLTLLPSVRAALQDLHARQRAAQRLGRLFETLNADLAQATWYHADWLQQKLDQVEETFDRACNRWRDLYRAAWQQRAVQHSIIEDVSRSHHEKQLAKRLRAEAESQMDLLTGGDAQRVAQSDFYSYRYFASEGFLPGYSFPRLPLSAYIPGRSRRNERDEFLSRPRFLAISEFGPRSIIYHEGSRYLINKVILPVSGEEVLTTRAKFCPQCGHLHPLSGDDPGPELCAYCNRPLGLPLTRLFKMQNVVTKRRDRINSDEEERTRMGYDLKTGVRFAERGDKPGCVMAQVTKRQGDKVRGWQGDTVTPSPPHPLTPSPETTLFKLTYGDAATLWRINLGWRRRKNKAEYGFILDVENGYWASNQEAVENDPQDPLSPRTERVIPYVEDRRNCLLIEPVEPLPQAVMASLQPALKNAIQTLYQLEDNELAAEPLPDADHRRILLLYESAEGGAGVLRQLVEDPAALPAVAREALALCHFDPETGADLHHAAGAKEDCEAACYDCLLSYANQPDHALLDRHAIRDVLLALQNSIVRTSPTSASRADHLRRLKALCDSDLERAWLDFLETHNLRLPDEAQPLLESCHTRPDFRYTEAQIAVYIDGPDHDRPDVKAKDAQITACLEDRGYTVVRFGYRMAAWPEICEQFGYVWGNG
ncbi:MAG: DEAD/DEAH box helicase [Anaerolineae bacterium]|nr:DEAD/DEAH box helicase [Anaerolineae bacterium]